MIIVVEGPDGSGKSTLIDELSKRTGIPKYECPRGPLQGQTQTESMAEDRAAVSVVLSTGVDVFFDRSFPSDWVYGHARERPELDDIVDQVWKLDAESSLRGGVGIMLLYDNPADAWTRMDGHIDADELDNLQKFYELYEAKSTMKWKVLDAGDDLNINIERSLAFLRRRMVREEMFMSMAEVASRRSTCLSRWTGAVLVSEGGHMIATGYNGAPSGCRHADYCERLRQGVQSGEGLDLCDDVHAEENCIVQAARAGSDCRGATLYTTTSPCHRCMRMLINAGITEVVYRDEYPDQRALDLADAVSVKMRRLRA